MVALGRDSLCIGIVVVVVLLQVDIGWLPSGVIPSILEFDCGCLRA